MLNLISKSKPDQVKLVGRVTIDLAKVINVGMYSSLTEFKLNFCSVEGSLILLMRTIAKNLTNLTVNDLDKSSYSEYYTSLSTALKGGASGISGKESVDLINSNSKFPVRNEE